MDPIIEAKQVEKYFAQPDGNRIEVIAPTNLAVYPGSMVALLGPSGSGKVDIAAHADRTGQNLRRTGAVARAAAGWPDSQRRIVFQSFALFPWLTVIENVEAPLVARGLGAIERHKRALR